MAARGGGDGYAGGGERIEPTHEWHQLELCVQSAGRRTYELICPVELFGHFPAERAVETGAAG